MSKDAEAVWSFDMLLLSRSNTVVCFNQGHQMILVGSQHLALGNPRALSCANIFPFLMLAFADPLLSGIRVALLICKSETFNWLLLFQYGFGSVPVEKMLLCPTTVMSVFQAGGRRESRDKIQSIR